MRCLGGKGGGGEKVGKGKVNDILGECTAAKVKKHEQSKVCVEN